MQPSARCQNRRPSSFFKRHRCPWLSRCVGMLLCSAAAFAQQPGTVSWSAIVGPNDPSPALISSPAIAPDGTIYIGAGDQNSTAVSHTGRLLYSLTPQGGTNWMYFADFANASDIRSSPSVARDGTIYCTSFDGALISLNPSAGVTNWIFKRGTQTLSSTALGVDGTIYVFGVSNRLNQVYAIRPDGTVRWTFIASNLPTLQLVSAQFPAPAIGSDGSVYCVFADKKLYAVQADGTLRWSLQLDNVSYGAPSVAPDGTIYVGTDGSTLYAVDSHGSQKWQFHTTPGSGIIESCPVLAADGTIYVGALDGYLYAISPAGTLLWRFPAGVTSGSPAIAADGTIYVSSLETFWALSRAGTSLWKQMLGISFSSPAIGVDGTVYVGIGQRLYAFTGTAPLQAGPWPMFRRDLRNNARAVQCAIDAPYRAPSGDFGFMLTVETGLSYRVQGSTDLSTWIDLTNFVSADFSIPFIDSDAANAPIRFYRLVTP